MLGRNTARTPPLTMKAATNRIGTSQWLSINAPKARLARIDAILPISVMKPIASDLLQQKTKI